LYYDEAVAENDDEKNESCHTVVGEEGELVLVLDPAPGDLFHIRTFIASKPREKRVEKKKENGDEQSEKDVSVQSSS